MYDLKAYVIHKDGVIQVALSGYLENSCYTAAVKDKYPGGGIVYIEDPGSAQVFIEETMKPGSEICRMMLFPWVAQVSIPDATHHRVTIFVNGAPELKVDVKDEPNQYRVIALTASPAGNPTGCSVIPADAPYLAIYSSVYGQASKADCETWCQSNCVSR